MRRPRPMPSRAQRLPAYESLPDMVRRIVREELVPVLDGIEELQALVKARAAVDEIEVLPEPAADPRPAEAQQV